MIIQPFNEQVELIKHILNQETRVIIYGGGIRGGKTFGAIMGLMLYLKKYSGAKATIVRDSLPTLKRNTLPVYKKLEPLNRVKSHNHSSQTVTYTWTSKTGVPSELSFFAENYDHDKELNRWRGLETNVFLLEEFNELQHESFNKAIERAGSWIIQGLPEADQPPPKIICTCNPSNGWVKELIYDKWVAGTLPKGWVYIPALITNSPHIPLSYRENLKLLPDKQYRTFVLGDWNSLELDNLFASEFREETHVITDEFEIDQFADIYLCFDFNISNTCLLIQKIDEQVRVIDEYHYKANLDAFCQTIKADLPEGCYITVCGDASGQSGSSQNNEGLYSVIKSVFGLSWKNFSIPRANPPHKASMVLCNVVFKNGDVKINARCGGLIKDLKNVQVNVRGSKVEIDKSNMDLTHHIDPLRYFINSEMRYMLQELHLEEFETK